MVLLRVFRMDDLQRHEVVTLYRWDSKRTTGHLVVRSYN